MKIVFDRKEYSVPRLTVFGGLVALVAAGSGAVVETNGQNVGCKKNGIPTNTSKRPC